MKYAAGKYGVSGVGVTVSEQQAQFARDLCKGLPIEIRLQDYREVQEKFDAVYSIGMFEHVGWKNYATYMQVVQRCLAHHAAAVILGHNHPSGAPEPSAADRAVTARLRQALALVDVRLLDHFIIGDGPPCSMARLGAL